MATTLYFVSVTSIGTGQNYSNQAGSGSNWSPDGLSASRGSSSLSSIVTSVTGPTAGIETQGGGISEHWISAPLDADVTISGSITFNLRAAESMTSANAAVNCRIDKIDHATGTLTTVITTTRTTEVGTGEAANNFAETPGAGVSFVRGDRIRAVVFFDDAGTMASGLTLTFWHDGPTSAASGDSFITFTEALTFASAPAGTQLFFTDTASDVSTSDIDRDIWTSRGAGELNDVTNTTSGWVSPIQVTDTAGGTAVSWFTHPLTAFTLGGTVQTNLWGNSASNTVVIGLEIAIVAGDGTGATVWASDNSGVNFGGLAAVRSFTLGGPDTAVTSGQRLRVRMVIDDSQQSGPMVTANTVTSYYGAAVSVTGDSYITLTQTVTEFAAAAQVPYVNPMPPLLAQ